MSAVKSYSTDKFTWTREARTFSTEASDLGVRPEDSVFGMITSRPHSTGLELLNPRTGGTMEFYLTHVEFNLDNEILWWTLTQATTQNDAAPMHVIIYND